MLFRSPDALVVSSTHINVSCANGSNGVVKINYEGGVSPYSINFNGATSTPSSSPAKFMNLSAGVYQWSLSDANGCSQSGVDTINQPIPVEVRLNSVADNNCNDAICNGSSTAVVTAGGTAPYSYSWTINGVVSVTQTAVTATSLCPNSRIKVLVTDANGCKIGRAHV